MRKTLIFAILILLVLVSPSRATLKTLLIDGGGTYTDWTNTYTAVDESVATCTDRIYSNSNNQLETDNFRDCSNTSWGDSIPDDVVIDSIRLAVYVFMADIDETQDFYMYWYNGTNRDSVLKTATENMTWFYSKRTTDLAGGSLSKADINLIEGGVRTVASPTYIVYVCAIRLQVYYTAVSKLDQSIIKIDTTVTSFKVRDSIYTNYSATADSSTLWVSTTNSIGTAVRTDYRGATNLDTLQATGKTKNTKYYFWVIAWDTGISDTTAVDSITTKTPVSILYPSASGTYGDWLQNPATTNPFDKVDDTHGAYDTSTYIYDTSTSSVLKHSFNLQNCNIGTDSIPDVNYIDSVVMHVTGKVIGTGEQNKIISGLWKQGDGEPVWDMNLIISYPIQNSKNYQNMRTTAPGGGYWTKSKLNALEIGIQNKIGIDYVPCITALHAHLYLADYTISGKVKDEDSIGVPNCTLTVTGSQTTTIITDDTGYYAIGVHLHDTLTFTPKRDDWNFSPSSRTYTNTSADALTQNFAMTGSTWALSDYMYRKRITFGTDHDVIPEGYTFELPMSTGRHKRIASNGAFNESIQIHSGPAIVQQSNGNLWCTYHVLNDSTAEGEVWVVKFDNSTKVWGTPYEICNSYPGGGYDPHHTPSMIVDDYDTLHIVYGCHWLQLRYRKSTNTDPEDSTDWTAEQTPATAPYVTYPRLQKSNDLHKSLYCFFRYGPEAGVNKNGYIKSIDNGNTWSAFDTVWKFTWLEDAAAYCPGAIIKNNVIHFAITPVGGYYGQGNLQARGIGYVKGEIDSATGSISWKRVDGTSVTLPVEFDTTDAVLFPVISSSAPWCGTNAQNLAVNYQGYPYVLYHCNPNDTASNSTSEVDANIVYWDGSEWQITNVSEAVTPNKKAWRGQNLSSLVINEQDQNIYFYVGSRPATTTDTALTGTDSTIQFDTSASFYDDIYNDQFSFTRIKTGTGNGQTRQIIDYTGSSRIAKVYPNWTTAPDNTSIYITSPNQYGAELFQFRYNGSNWSIEQQTNNSSYGIGQSSAIEKLTDNLNGLVWNRGRDIVYRYLNPSEFNMDGSDIRVVYKGTEIDRIINFSNFEDSKIYFKCKSQIDEDKAFDQKGNYYIYYGNIYADSPPCQTDSIYQGFYNFELYDDQETINGKDGFIANTAKVIKSEATGETITRIASGNKALKAMKGQVTKSFGTNLSSYKLEGYVMEISTGTGTNRFWFGVKNDTSRFLMGANNTNDEYFYFWNGVWDTINAIPHSGGANRINKFTVIVNDSGCSGYINDKLAVSNDDVFTAFDSLCIGNNSTEDFAVYYDYIILQKWLSNEPEETVAPMEFRDVWLEGGRRRK